MTIHIINSAKKWVRIKHRLFVMYVAIVVLIVVLFFIAINYNCKIFYINPFVFKDYSQTLISVAVGFTINTISLIGFDFFFRRQQLDHSSALLEIEKGDHILLCVLVISIILMPLILIFYGIGCFPFFVVLIHIQISTSAYSFIYVIFLVINEPSISSFKHDQVADSFFKAAQYSNSLAASRCVSRILNNIIRPLSKRNLKYIQKLSEECTNKLIENADKYALSEIICNFLHELLFLKKDFKKDNYIIFLIELFKNLINYKLIFESMEGLYDAIIYETVENNRELLLISFGGIIYLFNRGDIISKNYADDGEYLKTSLDLFLDYHMPLSDKTIYQLPRLKDVLRDKLNKNVEKIFNNYINMLYSEDSIRNNNFSESIFANINI